MQWQGRELDWSWTALEAAARWPISQPLMILHSGRPHPQWARRSILAASKGVYRYTADPATGRQGRSTWTGDGPIDAGALTHRPFHDLRLLQQADPDALWIGWFSYDLGRWIERLPEHAAADRHWPIIELAYCPGWLVRDEQTHQWQACGSWKSGEGWPDLEAQPSHPAAFTAKAPEPLLDRATYESRVTRVIDYIGAGDIFQANYTQRFTSEFAGPRAHAGRSLFARLAAVSPAWYGACLEFEDGAQPGELRTLASTSPELFLDVNAAGRVITRPIKGTRPTHVDPDILRDSEKDAAELNMIIDLLRNDLGRVCRYGSVKVTQPRTIESHPTVHHGVATIQGQLHPDRDLIDLLKATLPGGSITGAPKVRCMEIIDELEPVRRGPYCGCIGWMQGQAACLNIAIRTMLIEQNAVGAGRIDFSVGGGIVADSTPADEYRESLDKAAAMLKALGVQIDATSPTAIGPSPLTQ